MQTLEHPTPFVRDPYINGCDYAVRLAKGYSFPCLALVEENHNAYRTKCEDLRLYPLTDEGKDAANKDLRAIEAKKRMAEDEIRKAEIRQAIAKRTCPFCKHYPHSETKTALGMVKVCQRNCDQGSFLLGDVPVQRIIFRTDDPCEAFEVADQFKNI